MNEHELSFHINNNSQLQIVQPKVLKQPTEVLYQRSSQKKFHNIHRKTPVLVSVFNKVEGLQVLEHLF